MAAFAQPLQQNQNNFLGYSRGAEPDVSAGTAMRGLGNLIDQGANALDENIQGNIREDVYEGFDAINDSFGVDAAAVEGAAKTGPAPPLPGEVAEAQAYLGRLSNAFQSGKLKESHYWGRMETMVKSLRQRYPGYREQIDNIVADITGTTPANALRNSLLNEIEAEGKASQQGKLNRENYVAQNEEYIPEALLLRWQGGEDVFYEIQREVASKKRTTESYEQAKREMEHKQQTRALTVTEANENLRGRVNTMITQSISDANYVAGADYNGIVKAAQEAATDNVISKEEDAMIRNNLRQLETAWLTQFDTIASEPWENGSTNTYNSFLSKTELDAAREMVTSRVATLQNMLLNQQTGLLLMNTAAIEATKTEAGARILQADPIWQVLSGMSAIGMDNLMNGIFLADGGAELLADSVLAAKSLMAGKAVTGQLPDMSTGVDEMQRMKVEDPKGYELFIENTVDALLSPEATTEGALNIANTLFSPTNRDFLLKFDPDSQLKVFAKMASPEMTKRMDDLRKAGHTQQWESYVKWTTDNFGVLFKDEGATLQEAFDTANAVNPQAQIVYDEDTGQFELDFTPARDPNVSPEMEFNIQETQQMMLSTGIKDLNTYLKFLDPILEVTGEDKTKVVERMMQSIGIEFEADDADDDNDVSGFTETTMEGIQLANFRDAGGGTDQEFLDQIGLAEGADYNTFSGGSELNLTGMTVAEVREQQRNWSDVEGAKSSASGKYQIISSTMDFLINNGTLDPDEPFDEEAQDRAAMALLRRRGFDQFKAGKLDADTFLQNVAEEWASVPTAVGGLSAYAGDGINAATKGGRAIASMIMGGSTNSDARAVGYGNIPSDEVADFLKWNPDPIGNHETNLASVDPTLQSVVTRAQEIAGVKFVVGSGSRDEEQQQRAVELGWSKTRDSKHNHGVAVDLWALDEDGQVTFNSAEYKAIMKAMKQAAEELGVEVAWGGDWRNPDIPHFELKKTEVASN